MPHDAAAKTSQVDVQANIKVNSQTNSQANNQTENSSGSEAGQKLRLGRELKLLNGHQFKAVFRKKKSVHGRFFSIHAISNTSGFARFGVVVSRKVSKRAVQRNRIKRQIRESFRLIHPTLSSNDYVVVSKPGTAEQENPTLRQELDRLWLKADHKCKQ